MTPIEKAAKDTLKDLHSDISGRSSLGDAFDSIPDKIRQELDATQLEIILRHLAPLKTAMDEARKEMENAKFILSLVVKQDPGEYYKHTCMAKSWLTRNYPEPTTDKKL